MQNSLNQHQVVPVVDVDLSLRFIHFLQEIQNLHSTVSKVSEYCSTVAGDDFEKAHD